MVYAPSPYVDTFSDYLLRAANDEEKRLRDLRKKRMPHLRHEYQDLPEYAELRSDGRRRMEMFDRGLEFLFTHGGVRLGHLQQKLMNAVRMAALKRMYDLTCRLKDVAHNNV